jgi:hypothetical protein
VGAATSPQAAVVAIPPVVGEEDTLPAAVAGIRPVVIAKQPDARVNLQHELM